MAQALMMTGQQGAAELQCRTVSISQRQASVLEADLGCWPCVELLLIGNVHNGAQVAGSSI